MSKFKLNSFTQFELTEQEQLSATLLSNEQKMFIQTQKSQMAEQRLALSPDPLNYNVFIQEEAYLKGQMDFAQYLLDCSTASEQAALAAAQQSQ